MQSTRVGAMGAISVRTFYSYKNIADKAVHICEKYLNKIMPLELLSIVQQMIWFQFKLDSFGYDIFHFSYTWNSLSHFIGQCLGLKYQQLGNYLLKEPLVSEIWLLLPLHVWFT